MSEELRTRVRGVAGRWPSVPPWWSFSAISQAHACPRQWALTRADYPAIWDGHGYPPRPSEPALLGQVVHSCLEDVVASFKDLDCTGPRDPRAVEALRARGGYSELLDAAIDAVLAPLRENPRMAHRIRDLETSLMRHKSDLRFRVQTLASNVELVRSPDHETSAEPQLVREGIRPGSYTEVRLTAPELRMTGIADLLCVTSGSCQIFDYKSGSEREHHESQLYTYQVLWAYDSESNPSELPVDDLEVIYPGKTRSVRPLGPTEVENFAAELRQQVERADEAVSAKPPKAIVTSDNCTRCPVRHLCDEYWDSDLVSVLPLEGFCDAQLAVEQQRGAHTWRVRHTGSGQPALMHARLRHGDIQPGEIIRVLDLAAVPTEEGEPPLLNLTKASEYYVMVS